MYKDKAVKTLLLKVNIQKTRGDGHCFLYVVCDSWSKQLPFKNTLDLHLLKCDVFLETINNINKYTNFCMPPANTHYGLLKNLRRYLIEKHYNNPFADIVPLITSNALGIHLDILNVTSTSNVIQIQTDGQCSGKLALHRQNDHYSAVAWKKTAVSSVQLPPNVTDNKQVYTPEQLHYLRSYNKITRKTRKALFSYNLWKPLKSLPSSMSEADISIKPIKARTNRKKHQKIHRCNLVKVPVLHHQIMPYINLTLLNVRSVNNKTTLLSELIQEKQIDLFAITETWLQEGDTSVHLAIIILAYLVLHQEGVVLDLFSRRNMMSVCTANLMQILSLLSFYQLK